MIWIAIFMTYYFTLGGVVAGGNLRETRFEPLLVRLVCCIFDLTLWPLVVLSDDY